MLSWLKHAFAVEAAQSIQPTPAQRVVVDRLCREIVRRHLTTPALLFLEMSRPMNYLGAQALHFFMPLAGVITDTRGTRHFAEFLEQRGSIDHLSSQIVQLENQYSDERSALQREGSTLSRHSPLNEITTPRSE